MHTGTTQRTYTDKYIETPKMANSHHQIDAIYSEYIEIGYRDCIKCVWNRTDWVVTTSLRLSKRRSETNKSNNINSDGLKEEAAAIYSKQQRNKHMQTEILHKVYGYTKHRTEKKNFSSRAVFVTFSCIRPKTYTPFKSLYVTFSQCVFFFVRIFHHVFINFICFFSLVYTAAQRQNKRGNEIMWMGALLRFISFVLRFTHWMILYYMSLYCTNCVAFQSFDVREHFK